MNIVYPARITYHKAEGRYLVKFFDLDQAITEAESLEEALFNAGDVLTLTLEGRIDEEMDIPKPSNRKTKNTYLIAPSARVQAALLIRQTKEEFTIAELARALETSWPAASRLIDPHHWPSLKQLERTANVMGKRLVLSFESIDEYRDAR